MAKWIGVVREGTDAKGAWKESFTSKKPAGGQINERVDGFRARKIAMHNQDGDGHLSDANIEDRGSEKAFEKRPAMEEKETKQGVKEMPGLESKKSEPSFKGLGPGKKGH